MALIEGVKINLGGTEYVVPPLSFKQLRTLQPKMGVLSSVGSMPNEDQLDVIVEVIHMALSRNYPDLTTDQVSEALDLGNMKLILPAILGVSGLVTSGEGKAGIQ